ncbi:MAG TPA: HEPN domain-containing protein [Candidatus Kapabacteria bacterium]|nr:HEPN domain-containing protein [Candidatus Kapabacteria bacterium]
MSITDGHNAWIKKAEEDWLCIRNELGSAEKPWSVICFHAQQAAEKYLKAFLVFKGVSPERVHDLAMLLERCLAYDPSLDVLLDDCRSLTDFAIDARYPPEFFEQDEEVNAREAVEAARRITDAIRDRL